MGRLKSITHYHFAFNYSRRPKFTICIIQSLVSVTMQILFLSSIQVYTSFVLSNIYLASYNRICLQKGCTFWFSSEFHYMPEVISKREVDWCCVVHLVSSFVKRSTRWRHENTRCVSQFRELRAIHAQLPASFKFLVIPCNFHIKIARDESCRSL